MAPTCPFSSAGGSGRIEFCYLRASRQTDLESVLGLSRHAVCEWLGNSETTPRKHYLQITDADYAKVTRKAPYTAQQKASVPVGIERQESERNVKFADEFSNALIPAGTAIPPRGLQPTSETSVATTGLGYGGANSGALPADLAVVVERWPLLTRHAKATILGITRAARQRIKQDDRGKSKSNSA